MFFRRIQTKKYLFEHEDTLDRLLFKKEIGLFLDYDGTLVPIAETPDQALMTEETKEILISLSKSPRCHLAVISGRRLADLKRMIDVPGILYVGSHGFDTESQPSANGLIPFQYQEDLRVIKELLKEKLSAIEGIWVEDKEIILTIHFRLVEDKRVSLAKKILMTVCQRYAREKRVRVTEGKKVWEIRPPVKWDKGEAALMLLSKWQRQVGKDRIVSIYIGDDTTDEDAFRMLEGVALTIKVGNPERSFAHYFLKSQEEVLVFLKKILNFSSGL